MGEDRSFEFSRAICERRRRGLNVRMEFTRTVMKSSRKILSSTAALFFHLNTLSAAAKMFTCPTTQLFLYTVPVYRAYRSQPERKNKTRRKTRLTPRYKRGDEDRRAFHLRFSYPPLAFHSVSRPRGTVHFGSG